MSAGREADLKKRYGEEYPAAVFVHGHRAPLQQERRFCRIYNAGLDKGGATVSRFMDGSATMTLAELRSGWTGWAAQDRKDFCWNCSWLHEQPDYPDMLRFIMKDGGPDEYAGIALSVATYLPAPEAAGFLQQALRDMSGHSLAANVAQALSRTKQPDALPILRERFQQLLANSHIWDPAPHFNPLAVDVVFSIRNLLDLDAPPAEFEAQVRQLSEHPCAQNREFCRNHLVKYYPWLN